MLLSLYISQICVSLWGNIFPSRFFAVCRHASFLALHGAARSRIVETDVRIRPAHVQMSLVLLNSLLIRDALVFVLFEDVHMPCHTFDGLAAKDTQVNVAEGWKERS